MLEHTVTAKIVPDFVTDSFEMHFLNNHQIDFVAVWFV
jgi:hypothetical protein